MNAGSVVRRVQFAGVVSPGVRTGALTASAAGLVGVAASLPMSFIEHAWFWHLRFAPSCDFACTARVVFSQPVVACAFLAAGAAFGVAAQGLTRRGSPIVAAATGALVLYGTCAAAAQATDALGMPIDALLSEQIFHGHYPEWLVIALTFGSATAAAAGLTTLAVGLVVHAELAVVRAALVVLAVGMLYVATGGMLDHVPGWTIGLPGPLNNHAMPRVTLVSDLVAGSLGSWVALTILAGGRRSPDASYRRAIHRAARRPGLGAYLERRLGRGSWTMLRNWFMRSFGAGTFSEFWQYWNPVYGYVLAYYVYAPLRRICARPMAVWLTFLTCGFVMHDLLGWVLAREMRIPEMTVLFSFLGVLVVLSERVHLNLSAHPLAVRVLMNTTLLLAAWTATRLVVEFAGTG